LKNFKHMILTSFSLILKKAFDSMNPKKKAARIISEFWDTQKDRTARENDT